MECNGVDDDCDGLIDEGSLGEGGPDEGRTPCATGLSGECAVRWTVCRGGRPTCEPRVAPTLEVCDARDNGCDGFVDEALVNRCGHCGPVPPEVCNGRDDDCDGRTDEASPNCTAGQRCIAGQCAALCAAGECFDNLLCRGGFCVSPCTEVTCGAGQVCDAATAECVDPCVGEGCPDAPGPCGDAHCPVGSFCRDGLCMPSCAYLTCPFGTSCIDGECVDDPCAAKFCQDGLTCRDGRCVPSTCPAAGCGPGSVCATGMRVPDLCAQTRCRDGERCEVSCVPGGCAGVCRAAWGPGPRLDGNAGAPGQDPADGGPAGGPGDGDPAGNVGLVGGGGPGTGGDGDGGPGAADDLLGAPPGCACRVGGAPRGPGAGVGGGGAGWAALLVAAALALGGRRI